ncbi:MAG: phosphoribosylanthranilate isomerase [Pseudomonadota bacterium]
MKTPDLIKICGLSTIEAIDAAIAGNATHIGFIFFEKSPRNVSVEQARLLSDHAAARTNKVAVTVDAEDYELDEIVQNVNPDMLQLHGAETPARLSDLRNRYGLPVIKALAVRDVSDLEKAHAYREVADHLMFDAKPPKDADLPGGNGVAFDWEIMDQWPSDVPYILSGGLGPENVREAINRLKAQGIDVSSGVESGPGAKDMTKIRDFLQIVTQKDEVVE